MVNNTTKASEGVSSPPKSFRQLIDNLDLEVKLGTLDGLLSAANAVIAASRYDTFEAQARVDNNLGHGMELIAFSSNPEAVYTKLLTYDKESTGARLEVICGHCGQRDGARSLSSWGKYHKSHVKFLIDNFPEEL